MESFWINSWLQCVANLSVCWSVMQCVTTNTSMGVILMRVVGVCVHVCSCVCVCVCVCVVCVYVMHSRLHPNLCACLCACWWMYVCGCACCPMSMHVRTCVWALCACACVHVCMLICMRDCVGVCVLGCVCVGLCVWCVCGWWYASQVITPMNRIIIATPRWNVNSDQQGVGLLGGFI